MHFFECSGELTGKTSRWSEESNWILAYDNAELSDQARSQDGSLVQCCAGWLLIIARRMVTSRAQSRDSKLKTILNW